MASKDSEKKLEEQWDRISNFIEKLAEENERVEEKLYQRQKTDENFYHIDELSVQVAEKINQEKPVSVKKNFSKFSSDIEGLKNSFSNIHTRYDDVKKDLSGLLDELNDFKIARSNLESTLFSSKF
ncbi:MAG: hypothetical protein OEZ13_08250 [Spirochaetia bacterium]|nr:hypothetical protein [Spirochaetia bacterium]